MEEALPMANQAADLKARLEVQPTAASVDQSAFAAYQGANSG
jgi:hypothetical protein